MGTFIEHLLVDESAPTYPYLNPTEFQAKCAAAKGLDPTDDDVIDAVLDASLVVYYLTGRQFHAQQRITVRPDCTSCWPRYVDLGLWPVTDIITMRYDGVDQTPTDFHVDEYRYVRRNDGAVLPRCGSSYALAGSPQDAEDDPEGGGFTYEITVEVGMQIPRLIKRATQALACNILAELQEGDCDLPDRITSISRQGVSMEMDDYVALFRDGNTGIYAVEMAKQVFNPIGMQSPSFVWSPDIAKSTRRYT